MMSLVQKIPAMGFAITESPIFAKLGMYLGQNLTELDALLALSPTAAIKQLGKLEDRLSQPATPPATAKPQPTAQAKPPMTLGTGSALPVLTPENMSVSQLRTYMEARAKRR